MDRLQLYLAGVGVGDRLAAPHHAAEQGAVLPHQVRAAAGVSAQTVAGVRRGPRSEGVAGVEVAVGQEAAGAAGAVIAPVVAGLLYLAQLLAQLAVAGPLVAGEADLSDDLGGVWLALGHGEEGALGPGQGHQGQQAQQGEHHQCAG